MSLLSHSHHLYVMALNPLIGLTAKDTIEKVSIYLERLGRSLADEHSDPSIGLVTDTAIAALRYETERIVVAKAAPSSNPAVAGPSC